MVAQARRLTIEFLKYNLPAATGMMHGVVALSVGKPIDEAAILKHMADGSVKEAIESTGLPSMHDYFTSPPPTNAHLRAYLAECCRRWLAMLEGKP